MKNYAIRAALDTGYGEEDEIYLPLQENWEHSKRYNEKLRPSEAFTILKKEMEISDYKGVLNLIELVDVKNVKYLENPDEVVEESELWGIYVYKDLAFSRDYIYARPFEDTPQELYFCCGHTERCYLGQEYSKDFAYEECDICGRTICSQNPSNGWMSQGHYTDDGWICNRCQEEIWLKEGINEDFDGKTIPGQFFDESDILAAGWDKVVDRALAGHGYSSFSDPTKVVNRIAQLIKMGLKVLVNYNAMAIGGLGGYVSLYTKEL